MNQPQPHGAIPRYLEDLHPGERFVSACHLLDAAQIVAFASSYDPQPFHLDDAAARDTLFGGLAASGWHTAALTMRLIVTGPLRFVGGAVGAGVELQWPTPTRPDDVLQVESEVLEVLPSRSKPDRGIAIVRSETRNQHGEVRQVMVARMMVPRRPTSLAVRPAGAGAPDTTG